MENNPQTPPVSQVPIENNIPSEASQPKRSIGMKSIILGGVILLLLASIGLYTFLMSKNKEKTAVVNTKTVISPTQIPKTFTIPSTVQIPFVKNGDIYLYANGAEKLLVSAPQKATDKTLVGNIYPQLSPNGKYLAYIVVSHENDEGWYIPEGKLSIYYMSGGKKDSLSYNVSNFRWNNQNQLEFVVNSTISLDGKNVQRYVIYDPSSNIEVASEDVSSNSGNSGIGGFPLYSKDKKIISENGELFIVSGTNKQSIAKGYIFAGWSPDGAIAIFYKNDGGGYVAYSSDNPTQKPTSIIYTNPSGGAGGEMGAGLKWYFNKGFVLDCSEQILFVDGKTSPLVLTNTGGGGCNNSEGFVSTSPNGEYTFVKFDKQFELHTKDGKKTVIKEIQPMTKTRFTPKNLVWLDNDYMIIYQGNSDTAQNSGIYLFDRKANTIQPVIQKGFLSSFTVSTP